MSENSWAHETWTADRELKDARLKRGEGHKARHLTRQEKVHQLGPNGPARVRRANSERREAKGYSQTCGRT